MQVTVSDCIEENLPESNRLEYKSKEANWDDIAKEIVAFANHAGGQVIVGIRENEGGIQEVQDVQSAQMTKTGVTQKIAKKVEPTIEPEFEIEEYEGKTLLHIIVEESGRVHSFEDDVPVFPVRQNDITEYLHGHEITQYIGSSQRGEGSDTDIQEELEEQEDASEEEETQLLEIEKPESRENWFTRAPEGHISDVCLFSRAYFPREAARVTFRNPKISIEMLDHILGVVDRVFGLKNDYFVINQTNGAWFGRGLGNYMKNIHQQSERYSKASDGYELEKYKSEQAIFIANIYDPYPESTIVIYAEPWVTEDFCRHFTINLLLDGHPADTRPLYTVSELCEMHLDHIYDESIESVGIERPQEIPVGPISEYAWDDLSDISEKENRRSVSDVVCGNPFFGKEGLLKRALNSDSVSPISNYTECLANLMHYYNKGDDVDLTTERFEVTDLNDVLVGVNVNLQHVNFQVNW
jgi:hypothetical protein